MSVLLIFSETDVKASLDLFEADTTSSIES